MHVAVRSGRTPLEQVVDELIRVCGVIQGRSIAEKQKVAVIIRWKRADQTKLGSASAPGVASSVFEIADRILEVLEYFGGGS